MLSGHGNDPVYEQLGGKHYVISSVYLLATSQLIAAGNHNVPHRNHQEALRVIGNFTCYFN